jgi:hypothetical protein
MGEGIDHEDLSVSLTSIVKLYDGSLCHVLSPPKIKGYGPAKSAVAGNGEGRYHAKSRKCRASPYAGSELPHLEKSCPLGVLPYSAFSNL